MENSAFCRILVWAHHMVRDGAYEEARIAVACAQMILQERSVTSSKTAALLNYAIANLSHAERAQPRARHVQVAIEDAIQLETKRGLGRDCVAS
jgi:hypothetical protein